MNTTTLKQLHKIVNDKKIIKLDIFIKTSNHKDTAVRSIYKNFIFMADKTKDVDDGYTGWEAFTVSKHNIDMSNYDFLNRDIIRELFSKDTKIEK